jgi:hypothetical protein
MRIFGLPTLILLLSCSGTLSPDGPTDPDAHLAILACGVTLDAYCAQTSCVTSSVNRSRCGTFFMCPGYEVFLSALGEGGYELDDYDRSTAQLVAIERGASCLAGPTSFSAPDVRFCLQPGPCDGGS